MESLELQKNALTDQAKGLLLQLDSLEPLSNAQENLIHSQTYNFPEIGEQSDTDGTLTKQYNNATEQIAIVDKQLADIEAQIELYSNKSEKYISQFKSYYKEYINLKKQFDTLKAQIPVCYLISDSVVKGFNAEGALVVIQDKYGKYVVIEQIKYNASNKTRISAVYDQDNKVMRFSYNESNKLAEICNSLGERVAFRYDNLGYLIDIERDHQPTLTLSYATVASLKRITKISSFKNTTTALSYSVAAKLTKITQSSTVSGIAHDNVLTGADTTLSTINVEYTSADTRFTYDTDKQEIYAIDQSTGHVTAHYVLHNNLVYNEICRNSNF